MVPIQVEANDLLPLGDFQRRSADPRWNVLPATDLAAIRPLSAGKASEISALTTPYRKNLTRNWRGAEFRGLQGAVTEVSADGDAAEVGAWLQTLTSDDQSVIVLWNPQTAILTTWEAFHTHWDDFCCPSCDDVTVVPLSGTWLLQYDHEERFVFWPFVGESL